jgi:predicted nicotinamide N-methyase
MQGLSLTPNRLPTAVLPVGLHPELQTDDSEALVKDGIHNSQKRNPSNEQHLPLQSEYENDCGSRICNQLDSKRQQSEVDQASHEDEAHDSDLGTIRWLTNIVSSSLLWLRDDEQREKIWDLASRRLAERSGRAGVGNFERSFVIPLTRQSSYDSGPIHNSLSVREKDKEQYDEAEARIVLHEPALTGDDLGNKTWAASYVLACLLPELESLPFFPDEHFPTPSLKATKPQSKSVSAAEVISAQPGPSETLPLKPFENAPSLSTFSSSASIQLGSATGSGSDVADLLSRPGASAERPSTPMIAQPNELKPGGASKARNIDILELGSGTGLLGLAFAIVFNTHVQLTDLDTIVPNLERNVHLNQHLLSENRAAASVTTLDWTCPSASSLKDEKFDIILTSDGIYSEEHPRILVETIKFYLKHNALSRLVVALPIRGRYDNVRQDLWDRLQGIGLSLLWSTIEMGRDDWGSTEASGDVDIWCGIYGWKDLS